MTIDSTSQIHPSAIIEEGACIGANVQIGPFCHIGQNVTLGANVKCKSHVLIMGNTTIGDNTKIHAFSVLGEVPQVTNYEPSGEEKLVIGENNLIREHVTMNLGTKEGRGLTSVGNDCHFMTGVHVAHDSQIMNRVVMVNLSGVAGHCVIEDDVLIGGLSGVHQFVRIGRGAIIGGLSGVPKDVIPYGLVQAPRGDLAGLNLVGLKRRKVPREDITALRAAYQMLAQGDGTFQERANRLREETDSQYVIDIADFVTSKSDRSYLTLE